MPQTLLPVERICEIGNHSKYRGQKAVSVLTEIYCMMKCDFTGCVTNCATFARTFPFPGLSEHKSLVNVVCHIQEVAGVELAVPDLRGEPHTEQTHNNDVFNMQVASAASTEFVHGQHHGPVFQQIRCSQSNKFTHNPAQPRNLCRLFVQIPPCKSKFIQDLIVRISTMHDS